LFAAFLHLDDGCFGTLETMCSAGSTQTFTDDLLG